MQSQNDINQPGSGPWTRQTSRMPDLEDLARRLRRHVQQFLAGGSFREKIIIFLFILASFVAWTSFYTVPSDSVAVVQRFGEYLKEVPPGLHFKIPLGVDVVTIVPVKRQLKQEFGFATPGASDPYQSPRGGEKEMQLETQMVTGDLNAALVEWVIQYRISEPTKFLFKVREPSETLRYVSESVMREVVGDRTVDEVITIGRQEIESKRLRKCRTSPPSTRWGSALTRCS